MKPALSALALIVVAVAIGVGVFLYGGANAPSAVGPAPAVGTNVPFTELALGAQSSVTRRTNYLITSTDQLRELWKLVGVNGPLPTIDFTIHSVIAVFAGEEPTAGYSIAVSHIADGVARDVSIEITTPGVSCLLAQMITTPYQIIKVPATTLPLTHEDTATTTGCLQ